jgi:3-oxoacyl-[acyl-carrier-protein] synthase II
MVMAMKDAGVNPEQVGYLNAHGTSTPLGDLGETMAIKRLRRPRLQDGGQLDQVDDRPPAGCAGGMEAVFTVMALQDNVIPPTINLQQPGEGCDLDYVPNEARQAKVDVVMSNGFGFGGTNGTLVFKRV